MLVQTRSPYRRLIAVLRFSISTAAMTKPERDFDDDSYDEGEERLREQDPDEEERAYFPVEESKPPHY